MSKYKASNGNYFTQGLFYEWNNPDAEFSLRDTGLEPLYTARSGKTYKSLPYIFRQHNSEYECAIAVLGSWEHWQYLIKNAPWFSTGMVNGQKYSGLNDWRAEKEVADEALAKAVLLKAVENNDVNAAKFLYDKKTKAAKGRPEKKVPTPKKSSVVSIAEGITKSVS